MQATNLSTQLGLGSELVDWYRDAKPRTDDRLRYCTNTGSIPSKFYSPDRKKQSKILDDEHTKSLCSPGVPIVFPQMQNLFPQSRPKEFSWFHCECIINMLKGNLQSIKGHHVVKFQSKVRLLSLKRTIWKQKETFWGPKKAYSSLRLLLLPSLTICLDIEQFVLVPDSVYNKSLITQSVTKQELPNYQPSQNPAYQVDSLKKEINRKLFSKADPLVDKILSCPRIKLSNAQTLIFWMV